MADEVPHDPAWSTQVPTVAGWHWFYGHRDAEYAKKNNKPKELLPCQIRWAGPEGQKWRMVVLNGQFMDRSAAEGVWQPMVLPALPEESGGQIL